MTKTDRAEEFILCETCGAKLFRSKSSFNRGQFKRCVPCYNRAHLKAWHEKNKEYANAKAKRYYYETRQARLDWARKWRIENPEAHKLHGWKQKLKKKNCTYEHWQELVAKQNNCCALCEKPAGKRRLDVDHCHGRQVPRGLLCNRCNYIVGQFESMREIIPKIEAYLKQYE